MTTVSSQVEQIERINAIQADIIVNLRQQLEGIGIQHLNETTNLEEDRDAWKAYSITQSAEINTLKSQMLGMKSKHMKAIEESKKDYYDLAGKYNAMVYEELEIRQMLGLTYAHEHTHKTLDVLELVMGDIQQMKSLNTNLHDRIYELNEDVDTLKGKLAQSKCVNPFCTDNNHRPVVNPCSVCCREIAETSWEHEGVCCRSCSNLAQRCYVCRLTMYECDNNKSTTWTCMRNVAKLAVPKSVAEA